MQPELRSYAVPDRRPTTWWWFLIPLLTCGVGTFVMVLVGGLKLRSRFHTVASGVYFLLTVIFFVGAQFTKTGHTGVVDALIMPPFLVDWLGGIAHVLVLQMKVRGPAPVSGPPQSWPSGITDPALAAAQWRAQRRHEARTLLTTNPPLAAELRIGRPDVPGRQYDDGGLVDVNHVPVGYLVSELDLTPELAAEIVSQRDRCGGFSSPDELVVYCEAMTPERLAIIRDRLVFIPM